MSVHDALAEGRAAMQATLTEMIRVGTPVDGVDPVTGDPTTVLEDVVYGADEPGAPGRVKYVADSVSNSDSTGQVVALQRPVLKVPSGTRRLAEGLTVQVVSSTVDDLIVGRAYTIAGSPDAGQTTAHRYPLTELS